MPIILTVLKTSPAVRLAHIMGYPNAVLAYKDNIVKFAETCSLIKEVDFQQIFVKCHLIQDMDYDYSPRMCTAKFSRKRQHERILHSFTTI